MAASDSLEGTRFDVGAIPGNIPDSLENVDDMTLREQRKKRFEQDTLYRKYLAVWVMWIVPLWLISVLFVLVECAYGNAYLKDSVLISLLATTTANVLGLAYIVLKGLFQNDGMNNR